MVFVWLDQMVLQLAPNSRMSNHNPAIMKKLVGYFARNSIVIFSIIMIIYRKLLM